MSADAETRRAAESALRAQEAHAGFAVALLRVLAADGAGDEGAAAPATKQQQAGQQHSLAVRQAAAVYLKNYVKRQWEDASDGDRASVKSALVGVMLSAPPAVRRQLSEALAVVAWHDFPDDWPELLPALAAKMQAASSGIRGSVGSEELSWSGLIGVLETLEALFERYRHEARSDELFREILYSLRTVQQSLLQVFEALCGVVLQPPQTQQQWLEQALAALLHVCEIFYSLNFQDLPEFFEDHMREWMRRFDQLLQYTHPAFEAEPSRHGRGDTNGNGDDDGEAEEEDAASGAEPSVADNLHARIIDILNLYAEKYEEEFRPYLPSFLSNVWHLLVKRGSRPRYDGVATAGIRFLTTVSTSVDYRLFEPSGGDGEDVLQQVCERIVLPNVQLRRADEELLEDNPTEYVRADLEGSDQGTRRRAACELLKALCVHFEAPVTRLFSRYVGDMLAAYNHDAARHWKDKDTAIYLVMALSWKSGTKAAGATATSALVDVAQFYHAHVAGDLVKAGAGGETLAQPILVADGIKFTIAFRNQLDVQRPVLHALVQLLRCPLVVIYTYAARCLERLLASSGGDRFDAALREDCAAVLFSLLGEARVENEYVIRLLLRLAPLLPPQRVSDTVRLLAHVVGRVCHNPANPVFNHYVFETLALLVRSADGGAIDGIEAALFPPFQAVLQQDIAEFAPYVFQTLAQMLLMRKRRQDEQQQQQQRGVGAGAADAASSSSSSSFSSSAALEPYRQLLPPLLAPALWERSGYIPSMALLLQCFLHAAPDALCTAENLPKALGIFQKLVSTRAHDHDGLRLLNAIVDACAAQAQPLSAYLVTIVQVLMVRLQNARTRKYVRGLVACLARLVARLGARVALEAFDAVQSSLMETVLQQVWLPEVSGAASAALVEADEAGCRGGGSGDAKDAAARVSAHQLLQDRATGGVICYAMSTLMCESRGGSEGADIGVMARMLLAPTVSACKVVRDSAAGAASSSSSAAAAAASSSRQGGALANGGGGASASSRSGGVPGIGAASTAAANGGGEDDDGGSGASAAGTAANVFAALEYSVEHAELKFVEAPQVDPLPPHVGDDPADALTKALVQLSQQQPGVPMLTALWSSCLDQRQLAWLRAWLAQYGRRVPGLEP